MERKPHKSTWKTRKKEPDDGVKKEKETFVDVEVVEKLNRIKKYLMVSAVILIIPVLVYLFAWQPIVLYTPFINLIVVVVIVFFIYFPISELLKRPPK